MLLDQGSLFTAFSLSALGLAAAFFVNWLVTRSERFLIVWTIGVSLMALGVFGYSSYTRSLSPVVGTMGYTALLVGLACVYGAGREFRSKRLPWKVMSLMAIGSSTAMAVPMLSGYNGASIIILNLAAATILLITARDYWRGRAEDRFAITALSGLYLLTATSFVPCAALLLLGGHWILASAPDNWAEDLNIVICLTTLAGIGALSLALNQSRLARGHKQDAETDALTGLLNRRALLRRMAGEIKGPATIVLFDVDRFKGINDSHGHAAGDEVLRFFGSTLATNTPRSGLSARMGGEEFALLLPDTSLVMAAMLADEIRLGLGSKIFHTSRGAFGCTVSAGVAYSEGIEAFEALLHSADEALYAAKGNGRNQVAISSGDGIFRAQMHGQAAGHRGPVDLIKLKAS